MLGLLAVILFLAGLIILPAILIVTGTVGGFAIAKIIQNAASNVTNADVAAITLKWVVGFLAGGVTSAWFFGSALYARVNGYNNDLVTAVTVTIGLALVGAFVGGFGAKSAFQYLAALNSISEGFTALKSYPRGAADTNAIISFTFGIAGPALGIYLFLDGFALPVLTMTTALGTWIALHYGYKARYEMAASDRVFSGIGMETVGIILGWINAGILLLSATMDLLKPGIH